MISPIYILILLGIIVVLQIILMTRKRETIDAAKLKEGFNSLALEALSKQRELGGQELDQKKRLIDQRLEIMNTELVKVENAIQAINKVNCEKMEGVSGKLDSTGQLMIELRMVTGRLGEMLGSGPKRGEWGQRMAEDILNLAGLKENINYRQQKATESGSKPDYTFLLPNELTINMDCKFPFSNYQNYIKATSEVDKELHLKAFLIDVRKRLDEVHKKDYINPEEGTLDYAIMFIANEQIYNFINENDLHFMDEALKNKVVVCSPFTLFAFVSVIRQASENFKMEKVAKDILSELSKFNKQWGEYKEKFTDVGDAIKKVNEEYEKLTTTRTRMLDLSLKGVEKLSEAQGIVEV